MCLKENQPSSALKASAINYIELEAANSNELLPPKFWMIKLKLMIDFEGKCHPQLKYKIYNLINDGLVQKFVASQDTSEMFEMFHTKN